MTFAEGELGVPAGERRVGQVTHDEAEVGLVLRASARRVELAGVAGGADPSSARDESAVRIVDRQQCAGGLPLVAGTWVNIHRWDERTPSG